MKLKLRTYTPGQMITGFHFFLLNKGLNSGRPGHEPNVNCFVAEVESQEEQDRYYWLCYGLWITGKFKYYLRGSVIPFICKDEMLQLIEAADAAIYNKRDLFMKSVELLIAAQQHSQKITAQLKLLQQARTEILRHFLHV